METPASPSLPIALPSTVGELRPDQSVGHRSAAVSTWRKKAPFWPIPATRAAPAALSVRRRFVPEAHAGIEGGHGQTEWFTCPYRRLGLEPRRPARDRLSTRPGRGAPPDVRFSQHQGARREGSGRQFRDARRQASRHQALATGRHSPDAFDQMGAAFDRECGLVPQQTFHRTGAEATAPRRTRQPGETLGRAVARRAAGAAGRSRWRHYAGERSETILLARTAGHRFGPPQTARGRPVTHKLRFARLANEFGSVTVQPGIRMPLRAPAGATRRRRAAYARTAPPPAPRAAGALRKGRE